MAGFNTKTFKKHDDYFTPLSAWDNIKQYLPKDKVIWEAFYGDGTSAKHLRSLGCKVFSEDIDFFESNPKQAELIVSNPPFSLLRPDNKRQKYKEGVLKRLVKINKPFIIIMPSSRLNSQYFRKLFWDKKIQIIIPRKRIQFIKKKFEDGVYKDAKSKNACNFDCFYYCYKMNLPKDIIWLVNKNEAK